MLDVPAAFDEQPKPVQLTSGNHNEHEIRWSNDGARIYFLTTHIDEPYYESPTTDIDSISSTGGTAEKLATISDGHRRVLRSAPMDAAWRFTAR